jgi:hypothetical protein
MKAAIIAALRQAKPKPKPRSPDGASIARWLCLVRRKEPVKWPQKGVTPPSSDQRHNWPVSRVPTQDGIAGGQSHSPMGVISNSSSGCWNEVFEAHSIDIFAGEKGSALGSSKSDPHKVFA